MFGEQPLEAFSDSNPMLNELFLHLEALRQSENVSAYISLLEQVLQLISCEDEPVTWAALQFASGNAQQQNREGDEKDRLAHAIACYDSALTVYTPERNAANWAAVQQYKRRALCDLAELQDGGELLETLRGLVACCNDILTVCTREATPANWAVALYNKAMALYVMMRRLPSTLWRARPLNGPPCRTAKGCLCINLRICLRIRSDQHS